MTSDDRPGFPASVGHSTYYGIVQPWECDRNNHWNVQFYIRAFQMASEACAIAATGENPGAATARLRYMRFHRELFVAASVEVRSVRIDDGVYAGWIVHLLGSAGHLSATALEQPEFVADTVPGCSEDTVQPALPRSLDPEPHQTPAVRTAGDPYRPVGIVRPPNLDHTGELMMSDVFAFCSSASYGLMERLGVTGEWTRQTGYSRMALETKITRHGSCRAGDALEARSRITRVAEKIFSARHQLEIAGGGRSVASVEQFMVITDLTTRRAVSIPDDIRARLEAALEPTGR